MSLLNPDPTITFNKLPRCNKFAACKELLDTVGVCDIGFSFAMKS